MVDQLELAQEVSAEAKAIQVLATLQREKLGEALQIGEQEKVARLFATLEKRIEQSPDKIVNHKGEDISRFKKYDVTTESGVATVRLEQHVPNNTSAGDFNVSVDERDIKKSGNVQRMSVRNSVREFRRNRDGQVRAVIENDISDELDDRLKQENINLHSFLWTVKPDDLPSSPREQDRFVYRPLRELDRPYIKLLEEVVESGL